MMAKLKKNRGISMLEMMIVVVVIGLLAAISLPNFGGAIKKMKFDNEGKEIVSMMRYARSAAVTLQKPHGVFFDRDHKKVITFMDKVNPGGGTYEIGDSVVRTDSVESSMSIFNSTFPNQTVVFEPDGKATSSGYVYCYGSTGGSTRSFTIALTAGSGRVKLDYYQ